MASYHLSVHPNVSRGKGQSLVASGAYNARTRLEDERTGEVWDYRHLGAALASGLYAPKDAPEWAHDLGQLVNAVERFEKRSDAQLAMNLDIALPHEQTLEQNRRLMQDFVREQFQRKGYAAHFAIHPPDRDGDERNIHAHVLVTLRKIDEHGFARTKSEQQERYRNRGEFVEGLRESWEQLANRHLERNGYEARIDRRSLQEQGIEREPQQHRGPAVTAMERDGTVTRIGGEIRRRQQHYAELKALGAEEKQIDAQIIDLEARRAERETRAGAQGRVDQVWSETASREFSGAASETTQEAVQALEASRAPSAPEPETTRTDGHERGPEPHREAAPAHEAPSVIHLGPPAVELGEATEQTLDTATGIGSRMLDAVAERIEGLFAALGDLFSPPAPPTKEQAERMQQAAEERGVEEAAAREQAEKDARLDELLEQIRRDDAERERNRSFAERYGLVRNVDDERDREDDYDRGRERER